MPVKAVPFIDFTFELILTTYSVCGMTSSAHSKLKRLVPYHLKTPFRAGSIVIISDLSEGSPSFASGTTGSENCTYIEGFFTSSGSVPLGS